MNKLIELLPKNWNDIVIEQYQELRSLNENEFESTFEYTIEQIAILCNISNDDELLEDIDIDQLIDIFNKINWLKKEPNFKPIIEFGSFKLKDINILSIGEFIDLEHYFSLNYISNLHIICAILYKNYDLDKYSNLIEEPYEYNIQERSKLFLEESISKFFGVINYYLDFKKILTNVYHILFEDPDWDKELETNGLDEQEIKELEEELEKDKQIAKWNWQRIIYNLAQGDITKMDAITNLPAIYIFNILAMKKELKID